MNALSNNKYVTGVSAGILSALLMLGGQRIILLAVVFATLSVSMIIMAGLRSGVIASALAIIVAAFSISLLSASFAGFINIVLLLAPAGVMAYLATFSRPAEEVGGPKGSLAWYPLCDILFYASIAVAASTFTSLAMVPDLDALYGKVFTATKLLMAEIAPQLVIDPATEARFKSLIPVFFPFAQSLEVMILTFTSYYFAVRLSAAFGLSNRPREDIPRSLRMNQNATFLLLGGIGMMFVGGMIGMIGTVVTGAVAGGLILSGYAVLHLYARGKSWQLPGLIIAYLLTVLLGAPIAFFFLIGLANPHRVLAVTPNSNPPKQ